MNPLIAGFASINLDTISQSRLHSAHLEVSNALMEGRYLLLYWQSSNGFEPTENWEKHIVEEFLGDPSARTDLSNWFFASNGAVKGFDFQGRVSRVLFWVLLRKRGPKPYVRAKSLVSEDREKSRIPVQDPAFTRDVANNVWHFPENLMESSLLTRFTALCSWLDEVALENNGAGLRERDKERLTLSLDSIPKALKTDYIF